MGHSHHGHTHHHSGNIKTAFFLNLGFTLVEIIGGFYTNSMAILADALHDFGDSIALGTSWYFHNVSHKKRDQFYSYGYKRFSLIGAVVNAVILFSGSLFLLSETIPRLLNPQQPDAYGMIWLAVLGVIVNGLAVLKLKKGSSLNEKVVMLHLLEDVLGWVAVLLGAVIMHFFDFPIIDPILSLGIAIFILFNVFKNFKSVFAIMMQGVPDSALQEKVKQYLSSLPEIKGIHDLHIWSMDGEYNVLTVHVVIASTDWAETEALKGKIKTHLFEFGINHATLEFELEKTECEVGEN